MAIPVDLVPLPTSPWDERPTELPLDIEECRTALWMHNGNVTEAAKALKIPPGRLRAKIKSSQYLQAEQTEAREQLADIAEVNVRDALTDANDPGRRDSMTRFVLASLGRTRGYGNGAGGTKIVNNGPMTIRWEDDTLVVEQAEDRNGDGAKVING